MQHPQHQHAPRHAASGVFSLRPLALCLLLLLSLLAGLCESGIQLSRYGAAETGHVSAPAEERQDGERHLEEESPAKLRRVSKLQQSAAAQRAPAVLPVIAASVPATAAPALFDDAHSLGHPLPSLRQQRGQAPPQA